MWTFKVLRRMSPTTAAPPRVCRFCRAAMVQSQHVQHTTTRLYGQPTFETHPDLLCEGEITPGIQREEYRLRRMKLVESIRGLRGTSGDTAIRNHLVLIPSATKTYMSDKIPYPFRQNSDFFYLSGFQEADSVLAIHLDSDSARSVMFVPKRDATAELWDGPRCGVEGAVGLLGVDAAYGTEELESFCASLLKRNSRTMLWHDHSTTTFTRMQEVVRYLVADFKDRVIVESPRTLVQKLRLVKSKAEAELLRQSCRVATEAMTETMRASHANVNEAHLHAKMEFECRIRGAERLAYPPVVAGGDRANVIHYIANDQRVLEGEMILMDAGCELHGYASDLTRTWPVDGNFAEGQRDLYEVLLDVQLQLLNLLHEPISLDNLFHAMCDLLGTRLQEVGVISSSVPRNELAKVAYQFCPHHVSHYLGMDVHDTPSIPRSIKLMPGAVITVEPGIYIPQSNRKVPERFRGIGMRIEDDVLITESGPEVLTDGCPKSIGDVEAVFGGRSPTRVSVPSNSQCCEMKRWTRSS